MILLCFLFTFSVPSPSKRNIYAGYYTEWDACAQVWRTKNKFLNNSPYSWMCCKYKCFKVTSAQFAITFHIKYNDNEAMVKIGKSKINAAHYTKCSQLKYISPEDTNLSQHVILSGDKHKILKKEWVIYVFIYLFICTFTLDYKILMI